MRPEPRVIVRRVRDPVTKQSRDKPVLVVVRKRKRKGSVAWAKLTETAA